MKKFVFKDSIQERIWKEAWTAAGPRYTKDINVELPIKELFDGIGKTDTFFEVIEDYKKKTIDAIKSTSYKKPKNYKDATVRNNLKTLQGLGKAFVRTLNTFGIDRSKTLNLEAIIKQSKEILKISSEINQFIWEAERKENDEQSSKAKEEGREYHGHSPSDKLKELQSLQYNLRELDRSIRDIEYFSRSSRAKLANNPFLLILGQAGMGKTHLVCDITKDRIDAKQPPTIIVLGEKLIDIRNSLDSIFKACDLKGSQTEILEELNRLGKKNNRRSLIIIDAINEADKKGWKSGIRDLIKKVENYPWVGVVMTCRIPFEHLSLPKNFKIITEYHEGFTENELEAMIQFFKFYNLPLPEVPLLISEFSNPLFLSCFCKTAVSIKGGKAKVARQINDLALGQAGMTKVLEDFYKTKEEQIINKHNKSFPLLIKKSWLWTTRVDSFIKSVAKQMSNNGERYLKIEEVLDILSKQSGNKYNQAQCTKVLNILVEEGVVIRDLSWNGSTKSYFEVIKFSFHKFSDHLIARYLFDNFFNSKRVLNSLKADNPLGKLFSDKNSILANIDLVEALMVEFPERIKKNSSLQEKDLIDFIPKDIKNSSQVRYAFIESLYWRKPKNFLNNKNQIKKSIIEYINKTLLRYEDSSKELLNLFVATGTKPFHPLNAKLLSKYLSSFKLNSRDLFWTEYLRKQYSSGSVYKLISWIENQNLEKITTEQAWHIITVLGWTLTTNVRLLRNRATRCIYIVGKIQPEQCFNAVIDLAKSNDPYITERVLAASYGIAMSLHNTTPDNKEFLKILNKFAKKIYSMFFGTKAHYATTNILIRDYARGIIETALNHKADLLSAPQIKRVRPPYKNGIRRWGRSSDKDKGAYRDGNSPLGMDFENYTLGRLVKGRRNYDYEDKAFIKIKENVMWRLYNLGYSLEKFGDIDKEIASSTRFDRSSDYSGKVDRYGKKYSWIAYYELLGLRMDANELDDWYMSETGRVGELDIDPSFPQSPESKRELLEKSDLTKGPRSLKKWLVEPSLPDISKYIQYETLEGKPGPWVLVHGSIGHHNKKLSRKVTVFVDGFFADDNKKIKLEEFLKKTEYPGNHEIPSNPEIRDIFAGELGWRETLDNGEKLHIKIPIGERKVKLSKNEKRFYSLPIYDLLNETRGKTAKRVIPEYRTETVYDKIRVIPISRWFSSKDYSLLGRDEDGIGLNIPSKEIMVKNHLMLTQHFETQDTNGDIVSISYASGDWFNTNENLLYMRKDLLDKIIKQSNKKLFLIVWGERQYWPESGFEHRKDLEPIYGKHKNIFKELIEYNS